MTAWPEHNEVYLGNKVSIVLPFEGGVLTLDSFEGSPDVLKAQWGSEAEKQESIRRLEESVRR